MLEMQRLQPEVKRLQAQYRGDRQKLSEETMKLYQEHKVNPLASCLPLLLQMPIFFIMYRVLHGLTNLTSKQVILSDGTVVPRERSCRRTSRRAPICTRASSVRPKMMSFGLDLSKSPAYFISESFATGTALRRCSWWPSACCTSSSRGWWLPAPRPARRCRPTQAKVMQYLPVVFAVFQIFFLTGLVIYYITQAIFRIGQNFYITKRFYGHEESLGRQAQKAGERAREEAKQPTRTAARGRRASSPRPSAMRRPSATLRPPARSPQAARSRRHARRQAVDQWQAELVGSYQHQHQRQGRQQQVRQQQGRQRSPRPRRARRTEPAPAAEPIVSKRVTPPKNRPTPSASRPQRPTATGRPGAPSRPKPPKK